jgi:anti-sigma factor RsiW
MDYNAQLKLQAWLDGELPEAEAREVAKWLERDREVSALADELRNTGKALAGFETGMRLPESREFFWSKLAREIQRREAPAPTPAPKDSYFALFRRFLVPASALAVAVIAGLVLTRPIAPSGHTVVADIETALADAGAFTYRDYSAGTTLVWLSYPADNEVAEGDEMGTVE